MQIQSVIEALEAIAPPYLQESYDNAGLIVGRPTTPLKGVLFCLDSTEAIVQEALDKGCNLIVAHHPIVFKGLKRFNENNYVERTVMAAIKANVAIYAIHTNLDNVHARGVNEKIAQKLGLIDTQLLAPKTGFEGAGAGLIGRLPAPMEEKQFLQWLKTALLAQCVRHTTLRHKPISLVAVCGGAGSFLLPKALEAQADAFVTADFKYHEFFDAENQLVIADVGHYESEQFTIELLYELIHEKFPTFALHCTDLNTNPVHYLL